MVHPQPSFLSNLLAGSRVTRARGEEQSDPAGWNLVKRRQEKVEKLCHSSVGQLAGYLWRDLKLA